jgi:hypothetical protein
MWEPDYVEALVRADRREESEAAFALLRERAEQCGGRWHEAVLLRCEGLMAGEDEFRALFERSLAIHAELPIPFEHARTQLAFGERLRRAKARADAREPLQAAQATFERLGARVWAERATAELRASGQVSPKPIEYHLGQIYRKLDVRGRAQLARLMAMELPEGERDPAALADPVA